MRGETEQEEPSVEKDPYGPSYPESAARFMWYRIFLVAVAVGLILLAKNTLPTDEVPCIQDVVLDTLQPVTDFYIANEWLGLTLMSIMQLVVDLQLVGMLGFWFYTGDSMRYPIVLSILGVSKILLNFLFQTKAIENSFSKQAFPSLVFGENFASTYFFSGVMALLMINLLELYEKNFRLLFKIQLGVMVYVLFMLLSMRLNFFMDLATGLVFSYYVFYFVDERRVTVDTAVFKLHEKLFSAKESEVLQ